MRAQGGKRVSERKYRVNIQDRYFSDERGNAFYREPLKDAAGFQDIPFMNFWPELVQLRRLDDGFTVSDKIIFSAFRNGVHEPPVELEKRDMIGNQPQAKFSAGCRVFKGKSNIARCGELLEMQCEDAETHTCYSHTGWKIINGERVFLNGENSVTADGLTDRYTVELDSDLRRCYRFTAGNISETGAFDALLNRMPKAVPDWLLVPSLAYVFLSPLNSMLREKGAEPSFCFYLIGKTGSYKSSWAKVMLSFFGQLGYAETAPITFLDTQNAIGRKLALGADIPLLLDDRRPTNNAADKMRYEGIEKYVSSAIGDRAARGRLNADATARASYIARCNLIVTAEEAFQNIGSSSIARSVSVELKPDSICFDELRELQARADQLNRVMVLFLQWLIANYEGVSDSADDKLMQYREFFTGAGHPRLATAFSQLMFGYSVMLAFLQDKGRIDRNRADEMRSRAKDIFLSMCEQQSEKVDGERPTKLFSDLLKEMLETKQIRIVDLSNTESTAGNLFISDKTVGYQDGSYLYLIPRAAYSAVLQYYSRSGYTFPASPAALWKQFKDEGKLICDGDRLDKRKTINGNTRRYVCLLVSVIDSESEKE